MGDRPTGENGMRGYERRRVGQRPWQHRQGQKGLGLCAALVAVVLMIPMSAVLAEAAAEEGAVSSQAAYAAGPIAARPRNSEIDWPSHSREAIALAGLLAIVLGFRASGLARSQSRRPAGAEFLGSPRESKG